LRDFARVMISTIVTPSDTLARANDVVRVRRTTSGRQSSLGVTKVEYTERASSRAVPVYDDGLLHEFFFRHISTQKC